MILHVKEVRTFGYELLDIIGGGECTWFLREVVPTVL